MRIFDNAKQAKFYIQAFLYIDIAYYHVQMASITGIFLFIPCFAAFFIQRHYSGKNLVYSQYVSPERIEYQQVKPVVKFMLIGLSSLFVIFVVFQYAFIVIGAFTEHWGYNYAFSLRHLENILNKNLASFVNSVKLAVTVGFISSLLGVLLAYIIKTKDYPLTRQLDLLVTLPAATPGILLGIGYLVTFRYPLLGIGKYVSQITGKNAI